MKTELNPSPPFLPKGATKLILGTFPCFNGVDYGDFFYSGSGRNYFWPLLSEIFETPIETITQKKSVCEKNKLALCDIALRIERKAGNCSDSNLLVIEWNLKGLQNVWNKRFDRFSSPVLLWNGISNVCCPTAPSNSSGCHPPVPLRIVTSVDYKSTSP